MPVTLVAALLLIAVKPDAGGNPPISVRDVPWRDRTYDFGGTKHRFRGGESKDLNDFGQCLVCDYVRDVVFGDLDGDGQEEAIVLFGSNLGGAGTDLFGYVFGLAR